MLKSTKNSYRSKAARDQHETGGARIDSHCNKSRRGPGALLRCARWGLLVLGALVFGHQLFSADLHAALVVAIHAGPYLALILLAPIVGIVLHTLGWVVLFSGEQRPGHFSALGTYLAAQSVNELGAGVLGEPLKASAAGLVPTALDNLSQLLALFLFLTLGVLALTTSPYTAHLKAGVFSAALLVFAGLIVIAVILLRKPRTAPQDKAPAVDEKQRLAHLREKARLLLEAHTRSLQARPLHVAASVLLHLAAKSWIIVEMALVLRATGISGWDLACWLGLGSSAASTLGAFVPGQFGVLEGGLAGVGASLGLAPEIIVAIVLLRRLKWFVWVGIGLVFIPKKRGNYAKSATWGKRPRKPDEPDTGNP